MLVLGIETSCDETAAAIVKDGKEILSNVVSSQIDLHQAFGGVVPELACRRHADIMIPVIDEALKKADLALQDVDLIAATKGPGLIGALLIGLNAAKALSFTLGKPFIGVNHIEAHLYAAMMSEKEPISFPTIGCILSGGHTALVLIKDLGKYELIGQTVDDAIGEAFDKAARILGLPYPGGPEIERLALKGDPKKHSFKAGVVKTNPYHFSFSGLKTALLYAVKGQNSLKSTEINISLEIAQDAAASFQLAAFSGVVKKTLKAKKAFNCETIIFGGGVTNNQYLRKLFEKEDKSCRYIWPSKDLSLDNAAMIAGLGYHKYLTKMESDPLDLEALPSIPF
ncbi:MAG TPA: tRNA (adenosine(37)-N6)-threonylcarbamoyltransferase complex transferase subunit TsaD [Parachlamydiaceae bacterium]|nr:tRNA (adenosine(37)-N6)-threonylcarbamoyltransferase complex transferase subunit TsaD [Parachlamydiaceae bacterium]